MREPRILHLGCVPTASSSPILRLGIHSVSTCPFCNLAGYGHSAGPTTSWPWRDSLISVRLPRSRRARRHVSSTGPLVAPISPVTPDCGCSMRICWRRHENLPGFRPFRRSRRSSLVWQQIFRATILVAQLSECALMSIGMPYDKDLDA